MKVFVYRNLHKNCWSVKALEGDNKGRVVHYAQNVMLSDCTFKVSKAGRERVLRERSKNVHAGVVGELLHINMDSDDVYMPHSVPVTYNPYKYDSFVNITDEGVAEQVSSAWYVYLAQDKSVGAIL